MRLQASPLVSVLMPVYNAERFVGQAIESILAQSFQDFEFIIIDDGSTDGTLAVLQRYAASDPRIRLISRENHGLVATLNEGIELAQGEWLARMDADDIALPNRLAHQLKCLAERGADFCGGAVQCFGAWRALWRYPKTHEGCQVRLLFDVPFAHPTVVGRRAAFSSLRYREDFDRAQDYDLWQRAWAAGYRLVNTDEVVLHYRVHDGQVSARHTSDQQRRADLVRRRQWAALFPELSEDGVGAIVTGMREGSGQTALLLPAFKTLLSRYEGEAREVLLFDAYRMFCRMAGNDPAAAKHWLHLTSVAGAGRRMLDYQRAAVLLLISTMQLRSTAFVYRALRSVRHHLAAWLER
ncbi:glycosyltransferase family 2 protein [Sulfuricystis multivorans]|uniref:glycosyltransferase family 2 protein n=1 Tax=Sulfuricystis multivorans TaxID=2211108 RepID=UPI000F819F94|nr:glycosyltransferase [Sulfuricystis multivorans]